MISDKNEDEKNPPTSVETVESKPTKQGKKGDYIETIKDGKKRNKKISPLKIHGLNTLNSWKQT